MKGSKIIRFFFRFAAFDPMDVNKMHVEKIIFDIRTSQSKVEGYIIKGRNNKEMDYGFKQPKLEPGIGKSNFIYFIINFCK